MEFIKTDKQREAIGIMASIMRFIMLFGGSRSGKTAIIVYAIIVRATRVKSRHCILRFKFNACKRSIWLDTLPKVLNMCFPELPIHWNKTDYFITLPNGSEIWIGGLDDKERTEKILGMEFSTIFFNECSQIPFGSVNIAITRLAEKNDLSKKAYFDENPPNKRHWTYWVFIEGKHPETMEPLKNIEQWGSLLMNPEDNLANIDGDYLDILDSLPDREKRRFKYGEFVDDGIGSIYHSFSRNLNVGSVKRDLNLPVWVGMDFNVDPMTASLCNVTSSKLKVFDEIFLRNSNTPEMCEAILGRFSDIHPSMINIVPDFTGKGRRTVGQQGTSSDHEILRRAGFTVHASRNPFRIDRYAAVNNLAEKQGLLIDSKCSKLIRDLEQLCFEEGSTFPDLTDKTLGHMADGLGYLVFRLFGIYRPASTIQHQL